MATLIHDRAAVAAPVSGSASGLIASVQAMLALWASRIEERDALASFGWREMKDIAISESDLRREIAKPFWRA